MGQRLVRYLQKETGGYVGFSRLPPSTLRSTLRPGDVLLVEGNSRISAAIKYLTHSTWSHAAFYAGKQPSGLGLIEADLQAGVQWVSLGKYERYNLRICRPVGLSPGDLDRVIEHMTASVGRAYDLKNVIDLARYLLPQPPVPRRWRRRMLALGSGDPTRAICSTLIAEAFQKAHYPVLPIIEPNQSDCEELRLILHIRDHSLYVPRDFDLSPYFAIIKPTIESGFDPGSLTWDEEDPGQGA